MANYPSNSRLGLFLFITKVSIERERERESPIAFDNNHTREAEKDRSIDRRLFDQLLDANNITPCRRRHRAITQAHSNGITYCQQSFSNSNASSKICAITQFKRARGFLFFFYFIYYIFSRSLSQASYLFLQSRTREKRNIFPTLVLSLWRVRQRREKLLYIPRRKPS